jgi:dihydroorotase-like cyclic amidohydrolase
LRAKLIALLVEVTAALTGRILGWSLKLGFLIVFAVSFKTCSSSEEVKIIRKIKNTGLVTSETTPQHLLLSAPDIYDDIGSFAQMNPPIREKRHQKELWKGLFDGTINCIATDHAPHTIQEKNKPYGIAPSGMPGVETSLPLMLNQVNKGKITLQDIIKWMCENPAKIYQIKNKGFIKEGFIFNLINLCRIFTHPFNNILQCYFPFVYLIKHQW